jgi:LPXTG-motif cell wall-anchored protein
VSRRIGVVVALLLVVASAAPAAADEVRLSLDGQTWSDELRSPLYDAGARWVPGETRVRSFWVRDAGPSDSVLRIGVDTHDEDGLLADGQVVLAVRLAGGAWQGVPDGADAMPLVEGELVRRGSAKVDVRVGFGWQAPDPTMNRRTSFDLVVRLSDADVVAGENSPGGEVLPGTGSGVTPWLLLLGAALVGSGLGLVGRRRQEAGGG